MIIKKEITLNKTAEFMDSFAGSALGTGAAIGGAAYVGKRMLDTKLAPIKKGLKLAKGFGAAGLLAGAGFKMLKSHPGVASKVISSAKSVASASPRFTKDMAGKVYKAGMETKSFTKEQFGGVYKKHIAPLFKKEAGFNIMGSAPEASFGKGGVLAYALEQGEAGNYKDAQGHANNVHEFIKSALSARSEGPIIHGGINNTVQLDKNNLVRNTLANNPNLINKDILTDNQIEPGRHTDNEIKLASLGFNIR